MAYSLDFLNSFDKTNASEVKVNDGCIKSIWLENSETTEFDADGDLTLNDGDNALIEFENSKSMMVFNSEWCTLNYLKLK